MITPYYDITDPRYLPDCMKSSTNIQTQILTQQMNLKELIYQIMLEDRLSAKQQYCCMSGHEKTNCCNCGAPLKGKYKCEYCETVYL